MPQRQDAPDLPEVSLERVARFRLKRQCLLESARGDLAELVSRTGWLLATSGETPYLALFARAAEFHREDLDRAVFEEHTLLELPGARATTHIVPAAEGMLCLFGYARDVETRLQKLRQSARLTDAEMEKIESAVRSALTQGPLPLEEIRKKLGAEDNRDLGMPGQSTGYRNVFAAALAHLLAKGTVLKMNADGRLDRGRTVVVTAKRIVSDQRLRPVGPAETARKLAQLYFRAAGPASVEDFAWWAGLSPEESRAAVTSLGGELAGVRVSDERAASRLPAPDAEELLASDDGATATVALLLPHGDNLFALRRASAQVVRPAHARYPILDWRGEAIPAGVAGAGHHAPVVLDGFVAGAWEFDPEKRVVRWETFEPQPEETVALLDERAETLGAFIRDEIDPEAGRGDDALSRPGRVREMAKLWRALRRPPGKRRIG